MKNSISALSILTLLVASGCASITSNPMQTLSLSTSDSAGGQLPKASCSLKNDKGAWEVESPGSIAVHRSSTDLMVECTREGSQAGFLRAISRASGGMWGNVLIGGGIGALVDHSTGNGYSDPDDLPVRMGAPVTLDRREPPLSKASAELPAAK